MQRKILKQKRTNMKVVFLDAEGTLYVTKEERTYSDFWDKGEHSLERAIEHFRINDGVVETLQRLKDMEIEMVVVSKHNPELLPSLLEHLGISDYFTEIMINGNKGDKMMRFLKKRNIPKDEAVIVGDTHEIDIKPAQEVGIKGYLLGGKDLWNISSLICHFE